MASAADPFFWRACRWNVGEARSRYGGMTDAATTAPTSSDHVRALKPGDHVMLVDGSGYIFRAYHGLPPLTRKSDGLPIGAVAGFCQMLWKLMRDRVAGEAPTHLAVVFDASSKTFRNDIYADYKAHRPPPPEDLTPQFPLIRDAVRAFDVACVEQEGYEADDLIATYAAHATKAGATLTIVGSDKDLMQIVSDTVTMWDPMKNRVIGRDEVIEKFGVGPEKVIDVQALAGDSTDNVPGVPGIGIKTAAQLIREYGDLEALLARAEEIKQNKRRENLIEYADQARVSRQLVELAVDAPLDVPLDELGVRETVPGALVDFLREMELNTLTRRVLEAQGKTASADPDGAGDGEDVPTADLSWLGASGQGGGAQTPSDLAALRQSAAIASAVDRSAYVTIDTPELLDEWIAECFAAGTIGFDTETDSLDPVQANLVGICLASRPGRAAYIPLDHKAGETLLDSHGPIKQLPFDETLEKLKPLLTDPSILKVGQNMKYDWQVMASYGIAVAPFDDTMLLSYAQDAGKGGHGMDELAEKWLAHKPIAFKDVAGTGKSRVTFDYVAIDRATEYAAEDADVTLRLHGVLKPRLVARQVVRVYETLERPMVPVLARMERRGIAVDKAALSKLSVEFAQTIARLEDEIADTAGMSFNVGSPKQLGEVLFEHLKLPGGKKTKSGTWATPATTLEELAAEHPLPRLVIEHRQLTKLKGTYTDALQHAINPETGRVHTSFSLAATTTGRLSSSDPNLQNIPIRTEIGRSIRRAFVAPEGTKLVSADYSQIELRILAHMADIPQLREAFAEGRDIHASTAAEMFDVDVDNVDPDLRRKAKTINFGIIYGISAFGLAARLGIPRGEAQDYIGRYFARFPGIRDYIEETKEAARRQGYVTTLFGRRCHYPNINSKNPNERAFNERAAINAPIQGTAADIIRRAMIRMDDALEGEGVKARMLLQVHDELVFEAEEAEVDRTIAVVRSVMEGAAGPVLELAVPLEVDANAAANWQEAH